MITDVELIRYFEIRELQSREKIAAALGSLSERERALVREAAVMGFVRGSIFGRGNSGDVPRDARIVEEVVGACRVFPELYPTLGGPS